MNDAGAVLRIPADVRQLADVRGFIRSVAGRAGAGQQEMDDLVTAVDESVTNVIVHGYRGGAGTVEIEVAVADQRLVVRVRDEAPPFDPTRMPDVDTSLPPEQRSPGGLGIHLARDLADQVRYQRTSRGNELTLIKEIRSEGRSHLLTIAVDHEEARVPVAVMRLEGELDAATYLDLIESARQAVGAGGGYILLDLENLTYMSSAGLFAVHSISMLLLGEEPPDPEYGWAAHPRSGARRQGRRRQAEATRASTASRPRAGTERAQAPHRDIHGSRRGARGLLTGSWEVRRAEH